MSDLPERIEGEMRGRDPSEIVSLTLDNCRSRGSIDGLTDKFTNLRKLSIIDVGLTSLRGFPTLKNLDTLYLSDNRITGTLDKLSGCLELRYLSLVNNNIRNLDSLSALAKLPKLERLDVDRNPLAKDDSYREQLFELIPSLLYVDDEDKEGNEVEYESDDEGEDDDEEDYEDGDESGDDEDDEEEDEEEDDDGGEDAVAEEEVSYLEEGEDDEDEEDTIGLDYLTKNIDDDDDDDDDEYQEEEDQDDLDIPEDEEDIDQPGGDMKRRKT